VWTGCVWLSIRTSGGLLLTWLQTFRFHKRWIISFTSRVPISFSRRTLLLGVRLVI
jgi:hypothetical protein